MGEGLTSLQASLPEVEANLRRLAARTPAPAAPASWPERIEPAHFRPGVKDESVPWGVLRCIKLELALKCSVSECCDGQVYGQEGGYTFPRPCRCNQWRSAAKAITSARIPAEFAAVTPLVLRDEEGSGSFRWDWLTNAEEARDQVMRAYDAGDGVLLVGPAGDGKSHLAIALLMRRLVAGESGRWWSWRTYCEACDRAHYGRLGLLRPDDVAAMALEGEWLVLDDLWVRTGLVRDDGADIRLQIARLHDLLDRARSKRVRLIATSNIPVDALKNSMEDHVLSRLEAAMVEIKIVGPDRRRAERKAQHG